MKCLRLHRQLKIFIELRRKASLKPTDKMRMFLWKIPSDSKNYCGFVVEEFSKLIVLHNIAIKMGLEQHRTDQFLSVLSLSAGEVSPRKHHLKICPKFWNNRIKFISTTILTRYINFLHSPLKNLPLCSGWRSCPTEQRLLQTLSITKSQDFLFVVTAKRT